ncbi:MAG: hypothetical protein IMW91_00835 [Firmicutes bacterium]|nr:hypothetical protein [Bacillota bacterium]
MIRLNPVIADDDPALQLYQDAIANQWKSITLIGEAPFTGVDGSTQRLIVDVLSPLLCAEQGSVLQVATLLPRFLQAGKPTPELFLASMMLDEARHVEVLWRLLSAASPAGDGRADVFWQAQPLVLPEEEVQAAALLTAEAMGRGVCYDLLAKRFENTSLQGVLIKLKEEELRHVAFGVSGVGDGGAALGHLLEQTPAHDRVPGPAEVWAKLGITVQQRRESEARLLDEATRAACGYPLTKST